MHSRIFQISSDKISEDKMLQENRYDDYFVPAVADYVVKVADIDKDLKWLMTATKGLEIIKTGEDIKLKIVSKEDYFQNKFNKFQEYLERFKNYSLSDFIDSKNWLDFYNFKDNYDDRYGFYIDDNDEYFGIETLDSFMRNVSNGDEFYIGTVFDYHI